MRFSANKNVQLGTARPYNSKPSNQYSTSNSNSSIDADASDESQLLERMEANSSNNSIKEESNDTQMRKKMNDVSSVEMKCAEMMPKTPTYAQQKDSNPNTPAIHANDMPNKHMNVVNPNNDVHRNNPMQNYNDMRMNVLPNESTANKMQAPMSGVRDANANNYKNTNNYMPQQPYNYNSIQHNSNADSQINQSQSMYSNTQTPSQNQNQSQNVRTEHPSHSHQAMSHHSAPMSGTLFVWIQIPFLNSIQLIFVV